MPRRGSRGNARTSFSHVLVFVPPGSIVQDIPGRVVLSYGTLVPNRAGRCGRARESRVPVGGGLRSDGHRPRRGGGRGPAGSRPVGRAPVDGPAAVGEREQ